MDFLIHHMLQSSATCFPDKEALVDKDDRVIFQRAAKYIAGLADGLRGGPAYAGVFLPINVKRVVDGIRRFRL